MRMIAAERILEHRVIGLNLDLAREDVERSDEIASANKRHRSWAERFFLPASPSSAPAAAAKDTPDDLTSDQQSA
jgi:hypothetical protein